MDKTEKEVQKALGLIHKWDVYVRFQKDSFYTIYEIEATTKKEAREIVYEKIRALGCKIKKIPNLRICRNIQRRGDDIFVIGPNSNPDDRMEGAQYATSKINH
jgi:hypothetical protein